MVYICVALFIVHLVLSVWVIFGNGADRLEGTWWTTFFEGPAMDSRELKVSAFLTLFIWVPIVLFVL